jgi:hypothetical protein
MSFDAAQRAIILHLTRFFFFFCGAAQYRDKSYFKVTYLQVRHDVHLTSSEPTYAACIEIHSLSCCIGDVQERSCAYHNSKL